MEQQKDNQQRNFVNKGQSTQGQYRPSAPRYDAPPPSVVPGVVGQPVVRSPNPPPGSHKESQNTERSQTNGFGYVVRKAEKLTTALYLVTDIMSEKEPMKWKAREIGVELLSDITISSSLSVSEKMTMLRNSMKKIEKTIAFLDVAQSACLMSEMNSSVLKKEYRMLKDNIESEWNRIYEKSKSLFPESFFDIPREPAQRLLGGVDSSVREETAPHAPPRQPREHGEAGVKSGMRMEHALPPQVHPSSGQAMGAQEFSGKALHSAVEAEKKPQEFTTHPRATVAQGKHPTPPFPPSPVEMRTPSRTPTSLPPGVVGVVSLPAHLSRSVVDQAVNRVSEHDGRERAFSQNTVERDDRRKIVLALIKQKPALSVKDIAKSISHVSEKTIQRELLSMVAEGILQKRGERRWSTYSLRQ